MFPLFLLEFPELPSRPSVHSKYSSLNSQKALGYLDGVLDGLDSTSQSDVSDIYAMPDKNKNNINGLLQEVDRRRSRFEPTPLVKKDQAPLPPGQASTKGPAPSPPVVEPSKRKAPSPPTSKNSSLSSFSYEDGPQRVQQRARFDSDISSNNSNSDMRDRKKTPFPGQYMPEDDSDDDSDDDSEEETDSSDDDSYTMMPDGNISKQLSNLPSNQSSVSSSNSFIPLTRITPLNDSKNSSVSSVPQKGLKFSDDVIDNENNSRKPSHMKRKNTPYVKYNPSDDIDDDE